MNNESVGGIFLSTVFFATLFVLCIYNTRFLSTFSPRPKPWEILLDHMGRSNKKNTEKSWKNFRVGWFDLFFFPSGGFLDFGLMATWNQLDDSQSLHRKWLFHQTSIYKWLFGVPGTSSACVLFFFLNGFLDGAFSMLGPISLALGFMTGGPLCIGYRRSFQCKRSEVFHVANVVVVVGWFQPHPFGKYAQGVKLDLSHQNKKIETVWNHHLVVVVVVVVGLLVSYFVSCWFVG